MNGFLEVGQMFRFVTYIPQGNDPGIFFVLPCIETYQKVDLRTITLGVPPQEVLNMIMMMTMTMMMMMMMMMKRVIWIQEHQQKSSGHPAFLSLVSVYCSLI